MARKTYQTLVGWKQISGFLGSSIPTVRAWANDLDNPLPVYTANATGTGPRVVLGVADALAWEASLRDDQIAHMGLKSPDWSAVAMKPSNDLAQPSVDLSHLPEDVREPYKPTRKDGARQVVYFVHSPDAKLTKVGHSHDLWSRMSALRCSSPVPLVVLGLMPGTLEDEKRCHQQLAATRRHGEWFDWSDALHRLVVSGRRATEENIATERAIECHAGE
jgi:hypothetical protein